MAVFHDMILLRTRNIFALNTTLIFANQKCFKPLLHLIRSSTEIIKFDYVKFPAIISSKYGVSREFFMIDSNSKF